MVQKHTRRSSTKRHRFAVCWNGLVYPVATVGGKADLNVDVQAAIHHLRKPPLLEIASFRKAVLDLLRDKSGQGSIYANRDGTFQVSLSCIYQDNCGGYTPSYRVISIPLEGVRGNFRICDFVAWMLSEHVSGAPRCELYWPEARRDAAVAACAVFLRQYGNSFGSRGRLEFLRLDRPATKEQVSKGTAIFSLGDEGKVRIVRLPLYPTAARWTALKDWPREQRDRDPVTNKLTTEIYYEQDGWVYQAEEVEKSGRWQRYYGFVGSHRVARVPADEIEFPPWGEGWRQTQLWTHLTDSLDCRLQGPGSNIDPTDVLKPRLPMGQVIYRLEVRNRSGLDQSLPELEPHVKLRLRYSPERISRLGMLVPTARHDLQWVEQKPKPGMQLGGTTAKVLGPAEMCEACQVQLQDWFDLDRPGFYRVRLEARSRTNPEEPGVNPDIEFSVAPRQGGW